MAPTEDEILAALAWYRSTVLQNNHTAFVRFVQHVETAEPEVGLPKLTSESIANARQRSIYRLLNVSRPENLDPSVRIDVPADVLTKWHALVPVFALDGSHVGVDADRWSQFRQAYKRGVEAGLARFEGAEELAFPAELEVLMSHVDCLEGHGWPQFREEGQQVRCWDGLGESHDEVADRVYGPDDDLARLAGLEDWEITAGWQRGQGPEANCFVVYCRNENESKDWGWRYVAQLGQYGEEIFEDVVGLLQWYETFHAPPLDHRFDVHAARLGQPAGGSARAGLRYSITFTNGPSGTSDDDYYLRADTSNNRCAEPYGNAFLRVNSAKVNAGQRSYDPWWDNKLYEKTIRYGRDDDGEVTSTVTAMTNSAYCEFPSPGKKIFVGGEWIRHGLYGAFDRNDGNLWYSCDNYPGYSGPSNRPARRRRGRGITDELSWKVPKDTNGTQMATPPAQSEITVPRRHVSSPMLSNRVQEDLSANRTGNMSKSKLDRRQVGPRAGSFLDASAFLYLGCGSSDDDLCYYLGDACSDAGSNDNNDWDSPDPPSPSPPPPPAEPEPDADCFFWDSLVAWQFRAFNIEGWADDNGSKLLEEERGCGALTGWTFEEGDNGLPYARFYLPFFIPEGCVERAIVSAGGLEISCHGQGFG